MVAKPDSASSQFSLRTLLFAVAIAAVASNLLRIPGGPVIVLTFLAAILLDRIP